MSDLFDRSMRRWKDEEKDERRSTVASQQSEAKTRNVFSECCPKAASWKFVTCQGHDLGRAPELLREKDSSEGVR